jgi:hypothetical protein
MISRASLRSKIDNSTLIRIPDPEKNVFRIQDPGGKKAPNPGFGSATLGPTIIFKIFTIPTEVVLTVEKV